MAHFIVLLKSLDKKYYLAMAQLPWQGAVVYSRNVLLPVPILTHLGRVWRQSTLVMNP